MKELVGEEVGPGTQLDPGFLPLSNPAPLLQVTVTAAISLAGQRFHHKRNNQVHGTAIGQCLDLIHFLLHISVEAQGGAIDCQPHDSEHSRGLESLGQLPSLSGLQRIITKGQSWSLGHLEPTAGSRHRVEGLCALVHGLDIPIVSARGFSFTGPYLPTSRRQEKGWSRASCGMSGNLPSPEEGTQECIPVPTLTLTKKAPAEAVETGRLLLV